MSTRNRIDRRQIPIDDYVDRGPNSRQVIERLMDLGSPDLKLVCLKGNHEDIMWQCCRQPIKAGWWMDNGGGATLISYGQSYGDNVARDRFRNLRLKTLVSCIEVLLPEHRLEPNKTFIFAV